MQRCGLAKKGKKKTEELSNQIDSGLAGLNHIRLRFNFAETAQVSICRYLHGAEPRILRLGQSQGTGSKHLKTVNSHGCAELSAKPLINAHRCGFCLHGCLTRIALASKHAAGQITRLLWSRHRFRSFLTLSPSP